MHQDINLVQTMSVGENLLLNNEPTYRLGIIRRKAMRAAAQGLLEKYEIPVDPDETVGSLANDIKKMVQIVKAVSLEPKILILDEPTSSLTDSQVRVALRLIRQLASQGVGLVLISHYLAEIFEVCDDLTVMRDGEVVADGPVNETTLSQVVTQMVGRKVETSRRVAHVGAATEMTPLMAVENLSLPGLLQNVSFRLRSGEVLGVTGLAGSGLRELSRGLFGAAGREVSGRVLIGGVPVPPGDPAASLKSGIALLTNDRLGEGILPNFTLVENICLPILSRFSGPSGALDFAEMERTTEQKHSASARPRPRPLGSRAPAFRRKPAEGPVRQMAGDKAKGIRHGRADDRRRRRRQGRNPQNHRRDRQRGRWRRAGDDGAR